jgi:ABC-2 type transport system permease protein
MSALTVPARRRRPITLMAQVRHQTVLLARDPGPFIGYTVMPLLLITVLRPLYARVGIGSSGFEASGVDQATAGMAVMFSLFTLKVVGASLLNERTWHTWDRLRSSPASSPSILAGRALPMYLVLLAQQVVLFGFAAVAFGFQPSDGWWPLAGCAVAWSACVLLLGTGASTLARSPAQLSAAGDLLAILTTILAGALVPSSLLPGWLRAIAPASPGYWAVPAYQAAITGQTAALARPLSMMAVFGVAGLLSGIALTRRRQD